MSNLSIENLGELESFLEDFNIYQDEATLKASATFFNIYKAAGVLQKPLLIQAIKESEGKKFSNLNDVYWHALSILKSNKQIEKKAYPVYLSDNESDFLPTYDLDKWTKIVYKIYDTVQSNKLSIDKAVDYWTQSLDKASGEDVKFRKWFKYYAENEHNKYSQEENMEIKKDSSYQFGLSQTLYQPSNKPVSEVNFKNEFSDAQSTSQKKEEYNDWKAKVYSAIRRIDKMLRQGEDYLSPDMQETLASLLFDFDAQVRKIRYQVTASDLSFKTADSFKKLGFSKGSDVLYKLAQELPQEEVEPVEEAEEIPAEKPVEPPQPKPEAKPVAAPAVKPEGIGAELDEPQDSAPTDKPDSSDNKVKKSYEDATEPKPDEYNQAVGDVNINDAIGKLEEAVGRLSDRRVIRLLAEFDIMLDKIGIAAMFPELADAQSKLIDAYSYAQVRATKMLGMLSSGRSLAELAELRQNELSEKTMKEIDKSFADSKNFESREQGQDQGEEKVETPVAPKEKPLPATEPPQAKTE